MTQSGGNRRPQSQCSSVVFVHIVRLTRYVARRIQAASRRKAAKATVDAIRRQKQVEHNAAVSIQCFWRRKMAERALERRKAAQRLEKRRAAALEIQVRVAAAGASLRCTSPSKWLCRQSGEGELLANGCTESGRGGKRRHAVFTPKYSITGLTTPTDTCTTTR